MLRGGREGGPSYLIEREVYSPTDSNWVRNHRALLSPGAVKDGTNSRSLDYCQLYPHSEGVIALKKNGGLYRKLKTILNIGPAVGPQFSRSRLNLPKQYSIYFSQRRW